MEKSKINERIELYANELVDKYNLPNKDFVDFSNKDIAHFVECLIEYEDSEENFKSIEGCFLIIEHILKETAHDQYPKCFAKEDWEHLIEALGGSWE